jgi:hypothetical protein
MSGGIGEIMKSKAMAHEINNEEEEENENEISWHIIEISRRRRRSGDAWQSWHGVGGKGRRRIEEMKTAKMASMKMS